MKLTLEGLKDRQDWEKAGIELPSYDAAALAQRTRTSPVWVHFGVGNIFRIFIGGIADRLISEGLMDRGITGAETFDYDVVDKIYRPYDNLVLSITLHGDGTTERRVLGSVTEAVKAQYSDPEQWKRLKEIFCDSGLQMVSFTITEKGYALTKADGAYFEFVKADIEHGPEKATGAMAVVTAMLLERYHGGKLPLALVRQSWPWFPWITAPKTGRNSGTLFWKLQRSGGNAALWMMDFLHTSVMRARCLSRGR